MRYYANWDYDTHAPQVLRKDTRIYWSDGDRDEPVGKCIGTFIGENPGGGHSVRQQNGWNGLVECSSNKPGDRTLCFLYAAWESAVKISHKKAPDDNDYIEVLNTYYFRCPKSGEALEEWRGKNKIEEIYFQPVHADSNFAILGWGRIINNSDECLKILNTVKKKPVIYSDVNGNVTQLQLSDSQCLKFYPAQPSGIFQRGNKDEFQKQLLKCLSSYV